MREKWGHGFCASVCMAGVAETLMVKRQVNERVGAASCASIRRSSTAAFPQF